MKYNPVARKFYQMRRVLVETLGLPREAIRPRTAFVDLIPRHERQRVWARFHEEGIGVHELVPSCGQVVLALTAPVAWIAIGLAMEVNAWFVIPCALPVLIAAFWIAFRRAADIDASFTLGDAALETTTIEDCNVAEYRFTRHEILRKIRMVLSYGCNLEPSEITPEMKLADLIECFPAVAAAKSGNAN